MASRRKKDKSNARGRVQTRRNRRRRVLEAFGWRCLYCGKALNWGEFGPGGISSQGTVDHVVPLSEGGHSRTSNLVASCREHNMRRGNRSVEEYVATFVVRGNGERSEHAEMRRRKHFASFLRRWLAAIAWLARNVVPGPGSRNA